MIKERFVICFCLLLVLLESSAQINTKPYNCGFIPKDTLEIRKNFEEVNKLFACQSGEHIASVGAANGYVEVQIASMVPNIHWIIQDIDTVCLNKSEFKNVLLFHERIFRRPIDAIFDLVVGETTRTKLSRNFFDRILLCNVYHELSDRKLMMLDILGALTDHGEVVIMERMATKPGQKHGDCKEPKLWEPDFLREMDSYGYGLKERVTPKKKLGLVFYTFIKKTS